MFSNLFQKLVSRRNSGMRRRRYLPAPHLESLEPRHLLAAAVLLVDDDGAQFASAQYASIQAAVDAAHAGDIIKVAPGIYSESVQVTKALTIQGAFAPARLAENSQFASIVDPPVKDGAASVGFDLLANDIAIQGFSIGDYDFDAAVENSGAGTIGVRTSPDFSGYRITNSVIQDNAVGIDFGSSGAIGSKIKLNTIRNNNEGFLVLPLAGNGIVSNGGAANVAISGNTITDQAASAIALIGAVGSQKKMTIQSNAIGDPLRDGSGAPILLVNLTKSTVVGNVSVNSTGDGIDIGGDSDRLVVQGNVVRNAAFVGIEVMPNAVADRTAVHDAAITELAAATVATVPITLIGNVISGAGHSGILLGAGTSGTVVQSNAVSGSQANDGSGGNGIEIDNSTHNRLEANVLTANVGVGISVDFASSENKMKLNVASRNGFFDFEDESTGTLTAGTANVWTRNRGGTQNRSGLIG